jgi:hypothetical protein
MKREFWTPNRFVFHVASKGCRESILEKGLIGYFFSRDVAIRELYVHNMALPKTLGELFWKVYPFCLMGTWEGLPEHHDYWIIDTQELQNKWFVDPYMLADAGQPPYTDNFRGRYLYTLEKIPAWALTRFEINLDQKTRIRFYKDSSHVWTPPLFRKVA